MHREAEKNQRRGAALAFAVLAHALIIWALWHLSFPSLRHLADEPISLLILSPPRRLTPKPAIASGRAEATRRYRKESSEATGPPADVAPTAPPSDTVPPIDWLAEQQHAAESTGRDIWKQLSQRCRDAAALHVYPPECHRYIAPDPWEPEEKRFGLAGPLPYVRLGQCVVGLGFWGCALGKPPPNGHLLDGMRDPDRPGALPDNGSYQGSPEAREPLH